ncbi:MAG: DAK2 domain-containing protein [Christensenellaceae bacterium]|jgi:DAK2 domain fusion protein YloV|nr:DAK2 domain-containing protein [Christensenellaceae bacterium]
MITNLDAKLFGDMLLGAEKNIKLNRSYIDSLNVFPVPDGDTGTNMSLTMQSAVKGIQDDSEENTVKTICESTIKGALRGARGNSGVILSQIFKGMLTRLAGLDNIGIKDFADSLMQGSAAAFMAVTSPKEGTILTVIRDTAVFAQKIAKKEKTFESFFARVVKESEAILAKTPELLPVLKKAGVVDAGGMGLVYLFKGMQAVLSGEEIVAIVTTPEETVGYNNTRAEYSPDVHDLINIKYGYCTEYFIVNLKDHVTEVDIDKLRDKLCRIGDSVICIGDVSLVKVHVHSNEPDKALKYALELGELDRLKIENMFEQSREFMKKAAKNIVKKTAVVCVSAGEGLNEIFKELGVDAIISGGQTMNPSVDDIAAIVNAQNAETTFILPNNSNVILAATQAKELAAHDLIVIPTKCIQQGISAMFGYDTNREVAEIQSAMSSSFSDVRCIEITRAVKDAEIDGVAVKTGDEMGIVDGKIAVKSAARDEAVLSAIKTVASRRTSSITLYYGIDVTAEEAEALREKAQKAYPRKDVNAYFGGQPHYSYYISVE